MEDIDDNDLPFSAGDYAMSLKEGKFMRKNINCCKCGCLLGSKVIDDFGNSYDYIFIKKCCPNGEGSGYYQSYICIDCDPKEVNIFYKVESNMLYYGTITGAILDLWIE